jgi:hypothetical protein
MRKDRLSLGWVQRTIDAYTTSVKEQYMDLSQVAGSIALQSGQPLRIENGYGRRISVLEGHVWVTQDGDPRDIVLGAGDDFIFDRRAMAVLSALGGDARIVRQDGVIVA